MNYFLCSNWQDKKKEFGCGWAGRDDFRAGGTALFGLDGFATAQQGMKQGKQFFILVSVNKESGYESEKIALARLASPQTSFGVRSSRIHFSPTVRGGEGPWVRMNAWRTNPKGRLRGGYCSSRSDNFLNNYSRIWS